MHTGAKAVKSRLSAVALVAAAVLGGMGSILALTAAPTSAAVSPHVTSTGGVYTALPPTRVADTRANSTYQDAGDSIASGGSDTVNFTNEVPATATAVALNVTGTNATQNTYLSVYPTGDSGNYTSFSNINVFAGISQPNLVIVPLGTGQSVNVYNYAGTTDAVVDLEGYFAPSTVTTTAGEFYPLTPSRITDTRAGSQLPNAGSMLTAGGTLNVQVTGAGGVPSTGVSAVELNVTATNTTGSSYFTVYPTGGTKPNASNLNWIPTETIPNRVIVPVGTNGQISIFNYAGTADAVVDVDGYFSSGTTTATGDVFTPVAPARISDTRTGSDLPNNGVTLTPGATESVQVSGAGPVPATSATAPISAAVLNVTEATATAGSFLTVYPPSSSLPLASDLNFFPGFVVANADLAQLGPSGNVNIYNYAGDTNVVVDVFGYFTPASPTTVSVQATPTTLTANGTSTSSVTATVTTSGTGVSGDTVTFSVSPASCGSISPTTATTGSNGTTTAVTYTSSTTNEVCTVTALESGTGQSGATTITQSGATTNSLVITATPQSLPDNGSTSTLSLLATGADASGETVTLTGFPSVSGSCGSFAGSVTTGTNGAVTTTYTSSAVVGSCTILASAAASGTTGTVVIAQTPVSTVYAEAISINPTTIPADGKSTSSVTAGVTENGGGLANDVVTFTLGAPSEPGSCGTLASTTETTGSNGVTPADTYTASTVPGTCSITAKDADGSTVAATYITQQLTANTGVLISAVPASVTANGTSTSTLTVDVLVDGAGVSGDTVTLTGVGSPTGSCGSFPSSVTTGTNGAVTTTYTSSTTPGTCTIVATGPSGTGTSTVSITQTAIANVYNETITATPNVVIANGSSTSNILDTVTDNGTPVSGDVVTFTAQPSVTGACGTLASTETTAANGTTPTDTYAASSTVGTCTITAKDADGGVSASVVITQQASVSSEVIITANPDQVTANGTSTSTLTAGVFTNGAADNGDVVTLVGVPSAAGSCGSFPSTLTTGANGLATGTYTSSDVVGTCTILATGPDGTGTATVTISQVPVANVYNETITATPNVVIANGSSTSNILDTVTDNGTAVSGDVVTFTLQPSVANACGTLFSPTETTLANGTTPTDVYTASSTVGSCTVTAKDADGGVSASVVITQQASVSSEVIITANPEQVTANGTSSSTLTAGVFTNGAADNNDAVTLVGVPSAAGSCGSFPSTLTTGANGLATGTYTSSDVAGTCTILATGPAGTGTATVTISQTPVANVYNEDITATPNSLSANGKATSSILVGVTKNGVALGGDVVTFTLQPSVTGACGSLSSTTETTGANGITPSDTYTASSTAGTCTIIATEADGNVSANVVITQTVVAPVATKVVVTATPDSQLLVGDTSTITVETESATGTAVPDQNIVFTTSGNGLLGACGSVSPTSGTTNSSGVLTATYTVPNLAGILGLGLLATCTVTATDTSVTPNISGSASITETLDILALGAGLL